MPTAIESFDLSEFDQIISSSAIFSKGLILKPKTRHICYCYSPTRQLWDLHAEDTKSNIINNKFGVIIAKHLMRIWDRQVSDRVDEFVAISNHVRDRIKKYYRREAKVIYPPVIIKKITNYELSIQDNLKHAIPNTQLFNYYLIVSRLYKHKNIDIAIEAFAKLGLPLIIIGDGPEYKRIKNQASRIKNIKVIGFVLDKNLPYYYQYCRAFIMPQEEDFGITPIEAMNFGKPVIALRKGGATETVIEGKTGEFFDDPIPEALVDGVRRFNANYRNFNPEFIKSYATNFSTNRFKKEILDIINN